MELSLSAKDVELLREVLESALGDLGFEIADTDNAHFRNGLRERRDRIRGIAERLVTATV